MKRTKHLLSMLLALVLTLTAFVPAFAAETDTGFTDVAADSWYANAVAYVQDKGLMGGTSHTTFSPDATITRSMLATVLYRTAGSPAVAGADAFSDTADGAWYADAVLWASQQNIIGGYGDGLFGTNDAVSREQIAAILWRYADQPATATTSQSFADENSIGPWALDAVHWARSNNIMSGKSNDYFDPKANVTRVEVAVILQNYLTSQAPSDTSTPDVPSAQSPTLVVYFSMPETTDPNNMTEEEANSTVVIDGKVIGNTQYMAYVIQETTGADIFRIEPKAPYPLDHTMLVAQAQKEQTDQARPAIAAKIENLEQYDTIFVGYPNWWGDMPMILYTFLETYDLFGKTVIPFNTHGGSGFSDTIADIADAQPNATVNKDGLSISRNQIQDAKPEIVSWLAELGYK